MLARLKFLKERDGIPFGEQVRRALTMWFDAKGITIDLVQPPAAPPRKKVTRG